MNNLHSRTNISSRDPVRSSSKDVKLCSCNISDTSAHLALSRSRLVMALPRLLVSPPVFVFYPELYDGYGRGSSSQAAKNAQPYFFKRPYAWNGYVHLTPHHQYNLLHSHFSPYVLWCGVQGLALHRGGSFDRYRHLVSLFSSEMRLKHKSKRVHKR